MIKKIKLVLLSTIFIANTCLCWSALTGIKLTIARQIVEEIQENVLGYSNTILKVIKNIDRAKLENTDLSQEFMYHRKITTLLDEFEALLLKINENSKSAADLINNTNDNNGEPLLNLAIQTNCQDIVKLLLEKIEGIDVNIKGDKQRTPFHIAALCGHSELIEPLISKGAIISSDINGATPIHLAAQKGHNKTIEVLLKNGSNINCQDSLGWTPLHWAAFFNNKETMQLLIDKGADETIEDNVNTTASKYYLDLNKPF